MSELATGLADIARETAEDKQRIRALSAALQRITSIAQDGMDSPGGVQDLKGYCEEIYGEACNALKEDFARRLEGERNEAWAMLEVLRKERDFALRFRDEFEQVAKEHKAQRDKLAEVLRGMLDVAWGQDIAMIEPAEKARAALASLEGGSK